MEATMTPELARRLTDLAATTGRGADELVQDALAGYLEDLASLRNTLDTRYDDLKSGRVQPIDGEDAFSQLRQKSEQRRARPA
jgi:predicted DNA-binding protein